MAIKIRAERDFHKLGDEGNETRGEIKKVPEGQSDLLRQANTGSDE